MFLCTKISVTSLIVFLTLGIVSGFLLLTNEVQAETAVTSVTVTLCGNGGIDGGETCDDGVNNGTYGSSIAGRYCNTTCDGWAPYCGDSTVQSGRGEQCDDGDNDSGDGCSYDCQSEAEPEVPGPTSAWRPPDWWPTPSPETQVILQGKAYPSAEITVLVDGQALTTTITADSQANFRAILTTITPGVYTFAVWAEDTAGRKSITFSFTVTVIDGITTNIGGIFIPPTIELEKTSLKKGEILKISGQTAPQSEVSIFLGEIIKKTKAQNDGTWFYDLDTSTLEKGSFNIKAKAISPDGLLSSFSQILEFYIEKIMPKLLCPSADLNNDGKTNIVDFSILLFWWGRYHACTDQNTDGKVDLSDFSIMMYYWTG